MNAWHERLRVAPAAHEALLGVTTWASALLTVSVPFFVFGLARYSLFSVATPLLPARIVVIGLVGWAVLVTVVVIAQSWLDRGPDWRAAALLVSQAHLPLAAGAVAIYGLSFALQAFTASRVVAIAAGAVWFPASLVGAYAVALRTTWASALPAGAVGFGMWLMVVGRPVVTLVGHLL